MLSLTKLTYALLLFSLSLWLASNYIGATCELSLVVEEGKERDFSPPFPKYYPAGGDPPLQNQKDLQVLEWFKRELPPDIPRLSSQCPPVTMHAGSLSSPEAGTLTVIGEINLNVSSSKKLEQFTASLADSITADHLIPSATGGDGVPVPHGGGGMEELSVSILSSFIAPNNVNKEEDILRLTQVLEYFSGLGLSVVSLSHQHSQELSQSGSLQLNLHHLEKAEISWIGLNAKQHDILNIGGIRIGLVAFCGVHGHCLGPSESPFSPTKYFVKSAKESIAKLQQRRVDHILVILNWGKEESFHPDETALYIARHLSDIEAVSAIIGYHPQHVQGHAYFGNTLIVFSPGNFIISSDTDSLCWEKDENGQDWRYKSDHISCASVHPALRESLLEREMQTAMYRLHFKQLVPVTGEYKMVGLREDKGVRYPSSKGRGKWRTICGDEDDHCLSCHPF